MRALIRTLRQRARRNENGPMRSQERSQAGMTLIEIMLVLAILATVMAVLFGPTLLDMFASSKVKTSKILVDKYANEAYVRWQIDADDDCPSSIDVLTKILKRDSAKDSYGGELAMVCGDELPDGVTGIGIISLGKDKKRDTKDDIVSWKKAPKE